VALASQGDFAGAIPEFESAQAESPHPVVLFNLAQAYSRTGRPVAAVETAKAYLGSGTDIPSERRRQAEELITLNERRIGWVTVASNVPSSRVLIDGRDVTPASDGRVSLATGSHALVVTAPGYETYVGTFEVRSGETLALTPEIAALRSSGPRALPPAPVEPARVPVRSAPPPARDSLDGESRPWALGLAIAGGAVLAGGVITYVVNSNAFDEWRNRKSDWASTPSASRDDEWAAEGQALDDDLDGLHSVDRLAVALAAAGAVTAATGLVLYATAPSASQSARLRVSPLGLSAALEGTF
jgi:hypothetical protein